MAKQKNECDLSSCFMCRLCLKEWLPALDAQRKNFHFKKGELLFREGELRATGTCRDSLIYERGGWYFTSRELAWDLVPRERVVLV